MEKNLLSLIKEELEHMGVLVRVSSGTQIVTRCAFCGDSTRSSYSCHMYVGIPQTGGPISYYCHRCNAGGYVNDTFFKQYSVSNLELRSNVIKELRSNLSNLNNRRSISDSSHRIEDYNYDFLKHLEDKKYIEHYKDKFDYLERRLKLDFTLGSHLDTYRAVISPFDFLQGKLGELNQRRYEELLDWDSYCIGFLTNDGSRLILRSINPDAPVRRYHHITLYYHDGPVFYTPRKSIDMSRGIRLNFCEGIFDSINLSRYECASTDNTLNIAVLSKEYATKINHMVGVIGSVGMIDDINIYSDTEVKERFLKRMLEPVSYLGRKIKIYKNSSGDDFGEYEEHPVFKKV